MTGGKRVNIAGQRFGRLVALRDVGSGRKGSRLWMCRCDCGREHAVEQMNLRGGYTLSCGCNRGGVAANGGRRLPRRVVANG